MTPRPTHPDAVPRLDVRTAWIATPLRFGWRLKVIGGLGHPEKSTGFAFTRAGADRKARRWSR